MCPAAPPAPATCSPRAPGSPKRGGIGAVSPVGPICGAPGAGGDKQEDPRGSPKSGAACRDLGWMPHPPRTPITLSHPRALNEVCAVLGELHRARGGRTGSLGVQGCTTTAPPAPRSPRSPDVPVRCCALGKLRHGAGRGQPGGAGWLQSPTARRHPRLHRSSWPRSAINERVAEIIKYPLVILSLPRAVRAAPELPELPVSSAPCPRRSSRQEPRPEAAWC